MVKHLDKSDRCTVYYDGACPLCRAEIAFYKDKTHDAEFVDVSQDEIDPGLPDRETLLARFHVKTQDGDLVSGALAFAEIWKQTPHWRWLGHSLSTPPLCWIGEGIYRLLLIIRPTLHKIIK